jgi:hypothetical protein
LAGNQEILKIELSLNLANLFIEKDHSYAQYGKSAKKFCAAFRKGAGVRH